MASIYTLQLQFLSFQPSISARKHLVSLAAEKFRAGFGRLNRARVTTESGKFLLRAIGGSNGGDQQSQDEQVKNENGTVKEDPIANFQGLLRSLPPVAFVARRQAGSSLAMAFLAATVVLVITVRVYVSRKARYSHPGSVADLVRRGQLRSDRRGISKPLKYEDPFNNPMVKVGKSNSTIEMCGKVYRLAPVILTEQEQDIHRKRRSRAYQWKRPTVFLKEGDLIPPDVDPDTIRWIPANHPFATTTSDIDEDLAQNNVYQKHGVPFRIQAEHEALQKKLETLQSDQKLNKLVIDTGSAKDFERQFKFNPKSPEPTKQNPFSNQESDSNSSRLDDGPNSFKSSSSSEETGTSDCK
ncbi:hypothetical protein HS088_TW12G00489 [Tripterygium wilfordii]|uniref:Protein MULTIPLE CHLOROPLAST DIVISION SITE 1 n=1 Tax=Tripterygium wilfordii TaxID=458696 RepID=A0A7J7CZP0_TRIWF|nr:protein MULTIPLE CHLOROPLAST DIVISION SITE 1-like [Tripterygium wilfordii]KAF5739286.1 hypothetical protein HS088_TW12G00489 [Tripterygium wilfordii]